MQEKTKPESAVDPEAMKMHEYQQGNEDFHAGREIDSCPYPSGLRRTAWLVGWLDCRTKSRLGHIFEARGIVWP